MLKNKKAYRANLLNWYHEYQRDLPWRRAPSLYKTVVSEFMLQQTQVDTVLPYFDRWLKRFPDFTALAKADEEAVVKYWEGLGYYSRARNLHKLAKAIVDLEDVPQDAKSWQLFPGIGPYSSAAITRISFGTPQAVVDGNVIRVLSRLTANESLFKDNSSAFKAIQPLAQELIDETEPGDYNQAIMELGATICTRAKPLCMACPILKQCIAGQRGEADRIPKFQPRKVEKVTINRLWVIHKDQLLLHRVCSKAKRLANMYELPNADLLGVDIKSKKRILQKKRGISNQQILENIFNAKKSANLDKKLEEKKGYHWVQLDALESITLSGPHRKWVSALLA